MAVKKANLENILIDAFVYTVLILFCIAILYPFWSMLMRSLSANEFASGILLLPASFTLDSYLNVFRQRGISMNYMNTIIRTVSASVLCVSVTFMTAYVLSKKRMPFNRVMTGMVVFTMFFGGGLIPEYLLMLNLKLVDSRLVLILPAIVNGFYIMVTRNFIYSIPAELEESAFLDGAGEFTITWKIFMPLSLPIIATITLWCAVAQWNEWFHAMIYIRDSNKQVMQVILRRMLLDSQRLSMDGELPANVRLTPEAVRTATMFVAIGPIIILYPFVQKYFIKGLTAGAVKG